MCRRPIRSTSTRRWTTGRSSSPGASPSAAKIPSSSRERFDRFQAMVRNEDLLNDRHKRAFLLTPREKFVLQQNLGRAYDHAFLDIGYRRDDFRPAHRRPDDLEHRSEAGREGARDRHRLGLPVGLSVAPDRQGLLDRDHQAARRAHPRHLRRARSRTATTSSATSRPRRPTATTAGKRSRRSTRSSSPAASTTCRRRSCSSSSPAASWSSRSARPARSACSRWSRPRRADGQMTVARSDIYGGRIVPFVPFTKLEGDQIVGTHNN